MSDKKLKCYWLYNDDKEWFIIFAENYKQAKEVGRYIPYITDWHENRRDYVSWLWHYWKLKREKRYEPWEWAEIWEATDERYKKHWIYEA